MLDIDHFKSINDTYGHAAGDMVLREVARRLCATVRGDDEIGRLGGEEFALVLARVLSKDAEDLAERLRMSVAARPFDIGIMHPIDVTVSVGVATGEDSNIEDLLARADEALYQAKRTGRNRVICAWSKAFQSGH
jgi:diguanylate cyclase (GGDEF)-like protein